MPETFYHYDKYYKMKMLNILTFTALSHHKVNRKHFYTSLERIYEYCYHSDNIHTRVEKGWEIVE